jgi:type IV secretory pathway VirD2 relaxase
MARTDDERGFRLRPPKPRAAQSERAVWATGFKLLMHYARSSRRRKRRALGGKTGARRPYLQRCAVRVTYLTNKTRGQWKAHGRYVARESAIGEQDPGAAGFTTKEDSIDIVARLEEWQKAKDERLWKLIVSPEFGDRTDLKRLTRDLMQRMEEDLGTEINWVAVEHFNTEHPHVHAAVRGLRTDGAVLRMSRDYVQQGIRAVAEHLCTCQLGYRTELDAMEAERGEITETRFTSLDRRIVREAASPVRILVQSTLRSFEIRARLA